MDIQVLRYVLTLAEELHFRRAADRHYIAAQAFGRHVHAAERELGVQLFDRTSRRVSITPAGEQLVGYAHEFLQRLETLARVARTVPRPAVGPVRVGVLGFGSAERWPQLREAVEAQLPGVELEHVELDWDSQYEAVRRGEVDVGIVHDVGPCDGLRLDKVLRAERVAVVPASSPLAAADHLELGDVEGHGWVRLHGHHPGLEKWAGPASQTSRSGPTVRTPAAVPAAVATTGLLGVHGEPAARYFARPDVRFVPFDGPLCEVSVATRVDEHGQVATAFRHAAELLPDLLAPQEGPVDDSRSSVDRNRFGT